MAPSIAIEVDLARHVLLVAVAVGITGRIQPMARPAFPVVRRLEQPFHLLVIGILRRVRQKCVHFLDRGRQAGQIQVQPPQQSHFVGFRRWFEFLLLEPGQDELID
jgi:hypothetical protein